jgi:hypothetical protein
MLRELADRLEPQVLARAIGRHRAHMPQDDGVGAVHGCSGGGVYPEPTIERCDLVLSLCPLAGEDRLNYSSTFITREIHMHVTPAMQSDTADRVADRRSGSDRRLN